MEGVVKMNKNRSIYNFENQMQEWNKDQNNIFDSLSEYERLLISIVKDTLLITDDKNNN